MHICDWYATFLGLAGVTVPHQEGGGVPAPDSIDQWAVLSGVAAGAARTEVPLDAKLQGVVLIQKRGAKLYKLVVGEEKQDIYTEAAYPLASSPSFGPLDGPSTDCGAGCLFDVAADPEERHDLAGEMPDVLAALRARSVKLNATYWQHDTKTWDGADGTRKATAQAQANGGFWGPFEP